MGRVCLLTRKEICLSLLRCLKSKILCIPVFQFKSDRRSGTCYPTMKKEKVHSQLIDFRRNMIEENFKKRKQVLYSCKIESETQISVQLFGKRAFVVIILR